MSLQDFLESLERPDAPEGCSPYRLALWHEKRGNWARGHEIVQDLNDKSAALIHAYLHRREGDQDNAAYWYRQAGRPFPTSSLDEEWMEIVESLS